MGLMGTIGLPFDVLKVFSEMKNIFNAFPLVFRVVFSACFLMICLFAITKMLTR